MSTKPVPLARTLLWFLVFLAVMLAVAYFAAPETVGENLRPPLMLVTTCLCFTALALYLGIRSMFTAGQFIGIEVATIIAAVVSWHHCPSAMGMSNAEATRATNRAVAELTRTDMPNTPDLAKAWADVDRVSAGFPEHAPSLKAAREKWVSRLESQLKNLEGGQATPDEFSKHLTTRALIAKAIPDYRERIAAGERAWYESHLERLTRRLTDLKWSDDLRDKSDEDVIKILEERAPDIFAKLTAAEKGSLDRIETAMAAAIRDADPATTGAVLEQRATATKFIAKHTGRGGLIQAAESEWLKRCIQQGLTTAGKLEATDPVRAAEELVATSERLKKVKPSSSLPPDLKTALVRTVGKAIDAGRRSTRESIRADRYRAAATAADDLAKRLGPAAQLAELTADLTGLQQSCRYLAELAEKAGQGDPP